MPRKSKAELEIIEAGYGAETTSEIVIPGVLETEEERDLFRLVIETSPSIHLFSGASEALVIQYVRHILSSNAVSDALKSQAAKEDPKLLMSLLRSQKEETAALSSLAQKLKIAPSSVATWSGKQLKPKTSGPKPWEFGQ